MNRRRAVQTLAAAAAAAVAARPAKAAGASAEAYLKRWNTAKEFTIKVAQEMPAEHYEFKPTPEMRAFGALMIHLGGANTRYFARIAGQAPPLKDPPTADKETVQKFLAETFDWCAAILGKMTEEDMAKSYPGTGKQPPMGGRDLVMNGFIHTSHHRGYGEVYLRLKGVPPPRYEVI